MNRFRPAIRVLGFSITVVFAVVAARQVPADTWTRIGEATAFAAVSLQQANDAARILSQKLERQTAAANGGSVTIPVQGEVNTTPSGGAEQQPLTEPTAPQSVTTVTPPLENGTGGKIVEQQVGGGTAIAGLQVKNKSGVAVDLPAALSAALPFSIEFGTNQPQVLIYHTHTTEGYMPYDAGYYNDGDIRRDTTYPHNVTVVGDALEAELIAAGIAVIHDTTVHDYPAYRGAYERSVQTMEKWMKQYPSIKVTLDIHRDGLMVNSKDKLKPTVTVNGQKAAQLMLVCGVLTTDALPHPNWRQNLSFAAGLQQQLDTDYAGLTRPLSLTGARYNQYISTGSLLVEVGSEGNTIGEATYAARLLGKSLVSLFKGE